MGWYVGIDPGQTGGIALIYGSELLEVVPMPVRDGEVDGGRVAEILDQWGLATVVLEKVHSMPGQGVASTFKFGKSFGIIIGCVQAVNFPLKRVTPQAWKKEFGLIGEGKDASRHKAAEMWPDMADNWKLKKDNGLTDAALIAEYGRRNRL